MVWTLKCDCGYVILLEKPYTLVTCPKCGREYLYKYRSNKYIRKKSSVGDKNE